MERVFFPSDYLPILLQTAVAFGFVVIVMFATHFQGSKRKKIRTLHKDENFECGIEIKGNARFPFTVRYFLTAILFVLFDVEVIFLYPWAVVAKQVGWIALIEIIIFFFILFMGFLYAHKKGALKWK